MSLLRIKWENIGAIAYLVLATYFNIKIFIADGFDLGIAGCEAVLMALMTILIVYIVRTIRKVFLNL